MFELIFYLGILLGFSLLLVMGWLLMIVAVSAVAIYKKQSVRVAIQPLLDEF